MEDERPVRALSLVVRLPIAAWLGIAGIGVQAMLPLFLAFAIAAAEHPGEPRPALHPHHASHDPAPGSAPAGHHGDRHAGCILCLGLQAAGPVTLPAALAIAPLPRGAAIVPPAEASASAKAGSRAFYASRAPPPAG